MTPTKRLPADGEGTTRAKAIEAGARAIYAADHSDVVEPVPVDDAMMMPDVAHLYGEMATAAFDAFLGVIIDPGDDAREAGAQMLFGSAHDDWRIDAQGVWSAMIAALKEGEA